ncbi:MAG: pectinesterase family protein, partial [Candidatus Kuenenbacteria bacterium]
MDLIKGEKNKNQKEFFVYLKNTKVFLFPNFFKKIISYFQKQKVCILIILILMAGFFCFSFIPKTQAIPFPVDSKEMVGTFWENIIKTGENFIENIKKIKNPVAEILKTKDFEEPFKKTEKEFPVIIPSKTSNELERVEFKKQQQETPKVIEEKATNKKGIKDTIIEFFTPKKEEQKIIETEELVIPNEEVEKTINLEHKGNVINLNQNGEIYNFSIIQSKDEDIILQPASEYSVKIGEGEIKYAKTSKADLLVSGSLEVQNAAYINIPNFENKPGITIIQNGQGKIISAINENGEEIFSVDKTGSLSKLSAPLGNITNFNTNKLNSNLARLNSAIINKLIVNGDSKLNNLVSKKLEVGTDGIIKGKLNVKGKTILNSLEVEELTTLLSTLNIAGDLNLGNDKFIVNAESGDVTTKGSFITDKDLEVIGKAIIKSDSTLEGDVKVGKGLSVSGQTNLNGLSTTGSMSVGGNLSVNGTFSPQSISTGSIYSGGLNVSGHSFFNSLGVSSSASVGDLGVANSTTLGNSASNILKVNATSTFNAPVTMGSTLNVTGKTTIGGNLDVTGIVTFGGASSLYQQTIVVAKGGSIYSTIKQALDSITDNSSSKRYLIEVKPGTYEENVIMKDYIDIIGAGPEVTIIKTTNPTVSLIDASTNLINKGRLEGIALEVIGDAIGINVINIGAGNLTVDNVDITWEGTGTATGVNISTGSPTITRSNFSGIANGVVHSGVSGTTTITRSVITSTTNDIRVTGVGGKINSSYNKLKGAGNNLTSVAGAIIETNHDSLTTTSLAGITQGTTAIVGQLVPFAHATYDLGTPSNRFNTIYGVNINTTGISTGDDRITVNNDNVSADLENSLIIFDRGTVVPPEQDAKLTWDSINDRFDLNFPLYLSGNGSPTSSATLSTASQNLTLQTTTSGNINILSVGIIGLTGNTSIGGTLGVTGATTLGNTLGVTGATTLTGALTSNGVSTFNNNIFQTGAFTFSTGTGAVSLNGATSVSGINPFTVGTGATTLGGTLAVTGASTLTGNTSIGGTLAVTGISTLAGLLNANGGIAVDGTAFTVADTTGNTSIAGTLGVTGASTLTGNVDANAGLDVTGGALTISGQNIS